jgi:hypothetical protein
VFEKKLSTYFKKMEYSPPRRSKYARPQERESEFLTEEEPGLTRRSRRARGEYPETNIASVRATKIIEEEARNCGVLD